jgi:uncharacterized protein
MSLRTRLFDEMKTCMKEGKKDRLAVIRMLITEVRNAEINDLKEKDRERTEEEVVKIVSAYHKNLSKTMAEYPENRREPLRAEMAIVEDFLPKQISAAELKALVSQKLQSTTERQFGVLMKSFSQEFAGTCDGKVLSETIKSALAELG